MAIKDIINIKKIKTTKIMGKKSQMEIMGLAIIVVLLTLGILFVVQFVVVKEPSDIKKTFTRSQMAANMLNSILRTNSKDCFGNTISQLLKDCAENYQNPPLIFCEDNRDSCKYSNSTIEYIFNNTFVKWGNQSFYFSIFENPNHMILEQGAECFGERESKQSFIKTDGGILTVRIDMCS